MVDLKLENDERIICRVRDAGISDGKTNDTLEGLFLTNIHLISVYEKPFALFSKEKMIVDKKPLNLISICNGEIQVETVKDDEFEVALHIFYDNGMDYLYSLGEDVPKSVYLQWEDAIKKAVIENRRNMPLKIENNNENAESTLSTTVTEIINEKNEPINDLNAVFCIKCGAKNNFEAKFCRSCGSPIQVINNPQKVEKMPDVPQEVKKESDMPQNGKITYSDRKQEFVGKILKCPACGEIIPSFTAICPACGHELNSIKNSDILEKFIEQVNKCEELIAGNKTQNKQGWATWGKAKKLGWVLLNIIFFCIPLFYYFIWRFLISPVLGLIRIKTKPMLSKEEQQLVSLIENFPFPNDRETILAALIFAKEKIDFISKENIDRKSAYWVRLWCSKAEQLKQRADLLFPKDVIVNQSYAEILDDKNRVEKKIKGKAIIGIIIMVAFFTFYIVRTGFLHNISNTYRHDAEGINQDAKYNWSENDFTKIIAKPESEYGKIIYEYSNSFGIEIYKVSFEEFDSYTSVCRNQGFDNNVTKTNTFYSAEYGDYSLMIYYDEKAETMTIYVSLID